jgi:uncharacterized repeat protein (TIGR03806 family)
MEGMRSLTCFLAIAFSGCDEPAGQKVPFGIDARPQNSTCVAQPRPVDTSGVGVMSVWAQLGINTPIAMRQAPGDDTRYYVVEKGGTVRTFLANSTMLEPFINIQARVNSAPNEAGLLGMAFHPNWQTNHQVFLSYTAHSNGSPADLLSTVSRFTSNDGGKTLDPASEQVLLTLSQPYENHNGGNILFGPDGYLYIGFGDGGSGGDPMQNGQNLNVLFGKMLRINVDSGTPYSIPASNPFAMGGGKPEIYAWGLRNPWRWSFDRGTGDLWMGDVGQNQFEEVDRIELGGNYGWNTTEGLHCYGTMPCARGGITDPLVEYDHSQGNCVIGGYVYRGSAIPSLVGTYIYSDNGSGNVWALNFDPVTGKGTPVLLVKSGISPTSFAEGNDGELYLLHYGAGDVVRKLVPTGMPGPSTFPQKLSQTGCVNPSQPTEAAAGLIPYDLNVSLWSDGAAKRRWAALPDGKTVHVNADGDFDFPVGSVLMKEFSLAGKRIETRLIMRHADGDWAGYSYEWSDDESDATLLPGGKTRAVGAQSWSYPSRDQCLQCHTVAAGRTLGPELAQLDKDYKYDGGRIANELATWEHIGLFDAPLPTPRPSPLPGVDGNAPLEARARGYLHANCAMCHRPGGTSQAPADFRSTTPLAMMGICNADPTQGSLGVTGAKLLVPGHPEQSILSLRIHATNVDRMPPLASSVVDATGTQVIDDWIRSLASCN